jgi:hypothetical protein
MTISATPSFQRFEAVSVRATSTVTNANNTGADETVLAANTRRLRLIVSNLSAINALYLNFGAAAGPAAGLTIPVGGYWDSASGAVPIDAIHVLGAAGQPRCIIEL